jgi:hypothetical protein
MHPIASLTQTHNPRASHCLQVPPPPPGTQEPATPPQGQPLPLTHLAACTRVAQGS